MQGVEGDIEDLAERSRRGDRDAFRALVDAHLEPVLRLARHLAGNDVDAADLAQETFLRAWKSIASFRGKSSLKTWLCRIAVNLHSTRRASESRKPPRVELTEASAVGREPTGLAVAVARELGARLREAVDELPEKQRLALSLAAYEGLSVEEIASVLGSRPETVKVNLWLARKRLRERFGDELWETGP